MPVPVAPKLIRWISRRALRWFYREVRFVGREHVPERGPVLLIGNHPNDLPDVLTGFFVTTRPIRYLATISATTLPLASATYRGLGVIPVMRVRDVRKMRARGVDVASVNARAFAAVQTAFRDGAAVGVFPEGGVHDTSRVGAPRAGVAKMALEYINSDSKDDLSIVPFGLQYESGQTARSDVLIEIGRPISLRGWVEAEQAAGRTADTGALSSRLHEALLAVTRNSHSWHEAGIRDRLVAAVAALHTEPGGFPIETAMRCQQRCARLVELSDPTAAEHADRSVHWRTIAEPITESVRRAGGMETSASDTARVLAAAEVPGVDGRWPSAAWLAFLAVPALVGLVVHAPLWAAARGRARRSLVVRTDYAAKAILPGLHLILLGYLLLGAVFALSLRASGWSSWWAAVGLVALPRLGDLGLSWWDAARALRVRARVRAWKAAERTALQDAAQRVRRAWSDVA